MTAATATVRAGLGQRPLRASKHQTHVVRRGWGTASVWSTDSSNRTGTTSTNSSQARGKAARPCWDLSAATAGVCAAVSSTLTCALCFAVRRCAPCMSTGSHINWMEASLEQLSAPLPPWAIRAGARETIYHDPRNTTAAIVTCGGLCPGLNDVVAVRPACC